MDELRILTPAGMIGFGFPEESFKLGMAMQPHAIAIDGGTIDCGPYPLGSGTVFEGKSSVKHDFEIMLKAAVTAKIPVILGSATTSGAKPHVDWTLEIVKEVAREQGLKLKIAIIYSDIDKSYLKKQLTQGQVITFESRIDLTSAEIDLSTHIVAQLGPEPFIEALKHKPDLIIAGRAYDPAVIAAFAIAHGYDRGLAIHMGKILECGCLACEPMSGGDIIIGTIRKDHFIVEPANKANRRCTTVSVAAHTFYEKHSPIHFETPGGILDLTDSHFEQFNEHAVKVSGSRFIPDETYMIKLEGAKPTGFRSIFIAGMRDPLTIANFDLIKDKATEMIKSLRPDLTEDDYKIIFHAYGKNAVMGALEPVKTPAHELGLVGEVLAKTQELAQEICTELFHCVMHYDYPGRKATAANIAYPFSQLVIPVGECFEFNIYHLLKVTDPLQISPISIIEV